MSGEPRMPHEERERPDDLDREGQMGSPELVCPICFSARHLAEDALVEHAQLGGATPLWQWIGDSATVFSY